MAKKDYKTALAVGGIILLAGALGIAISMEQIRTVQAYVRKYARPGTYFSWVEFMRSATASAYNITQQYYPPLQAFKNARALVQNVMDPLREASGLPIEVNSWYRSQELTNKLIDLGYTAAPNSKHKRGDVIDVEQFVNGVENNGRLALLAVQNNLPFDRMIIEYGTDENPGLIQFEYDASKPPSEQRQQILRMTDSVSGLPVWSKETVIQLYS